MRITSSPDCPRCGGPIGRSLPGPAPTGARSLPWRRWWPLAVYEVALVSTTILWLLGRDTSVLPMLLLVGAYGVAAHRTRADMVVVAVTSVAAFGLLWWGPGQPYAAWEFTVSAAGLVISLGLGRGARLGRELAEQRVILAHEAARRRVSEERLEIARDLHDLLGQSLTAIAVQAGVGGHLIGTDPGRAQASLANIAQVSRAALDDVRRVVAAMRENDPIARAGQRLSSVEDLAALARLGGLRVEVTLPPRDEPLPTRVEETAVAIVREALTNIVRHAAQAGSATVRVVRRDALIDICVSDDGCIASPEPLASGSPQALGNGLTGMRERAAAVGGTLTAGPVASGGYLVHAQLPLAGDVAC